VRAAAEDEQLAVVAVEIEIVGVLEDFRIPIRPAEREHQHLVLYGRAELIDDLEVVTQTLISVTMHRGPETAAGRVVSWDHRKLGGTY
jgi:hypothetical protein